VSGADDVRPDARPNIFAGPGAMRAQCRALDWAATPLGTPDTWPQSLRTAAAAVLGAGFPTVLLWGPDLVQLYNDPCVPLLGARHPASLGQPTRACWPELWDVAAPTYARVQAGETVTLEDAHYAVRRRGSEGPVEDLYLTLAYGPAPDEAGRVAGILVTLLDTTAQVLGRAAQDEQARLEAGLHRARAETALVLEQVSDAYVLMDSEFRITAVNPSAERVLGQARADLVGRVHWEAFPASVGAEPERQYRRVQAERVEAHFVHHYVGEGYDFHLEIDAYPVGDEGVAVFWRDVSERVRAAVAVEAARADADARVATLAAVIDSIPDAVLVAGQEGLTLANQAALAQLGVPSLEALRAATPTARLPLAGLLLDPATGAPVAPEALPIGRALLGARSHAHFLLRARGAAGEDGAVGVRPVRAAAAPIVGPDGTVLGAVAVLTDMTRQQAAAAERDRLLAALEAERTLLRTVLDQLPAAVMIVEAPSGRVLAMNAAVTRLWGGAGPHSEAASQYSDAWVGYHADGRRIASEEWPAARAVLAGETVTDWVGEIERPDGARVIVEVSAAPVRDAGGQTVAAVAVAADITARVQTGRERERLLRELELERARLAYVFRQAPTFLAVLRGPTHVFELVNAAYTQLVGRHDLVGQPLLTALPELREQGFLELLDGVLASGEPFVGRAVPVSLARMPGAVPELRFVDFVYQPVVEADGTRSGVIAHGSDVTEQVQARREVERLLAESEQARRDAEMARAEAQAANRAKSEFLAVMSHELRTPLNAIGGYAELMELGIRGPVTEQQLEDLGRIQRSQRHLLGLVNEVLNYAKLESGNVRYALADVPVPDALADAAALVVPQARAKGLTLTIGECPPDLAVRADSEKLRQVLVNVLGNAVKFTDTRGHVTVTCADRAPWVALQVRDTGIGIPADKLGAIFEPFVQVRADLTRTADGTGLGLAISRDLARGMGGDLTAESTPGVGSTFTLTLPALGPKGT
jgi:PAS domain S-box-containing protein